MGKKFVAIRICFVVEGDVSSKAEAETECRKEWMTTIIIYSRQHRPPKRETRRSPIIQSQIGCVALHSCLTFWYWTCDSLQWIEAPPRLYSSEWGWNDEVQLLYLGEKCMDGVDSNPRLKSGFNGSPNGISLIQMKRFAHSSDIEGWVVFIWRMAVANIDALVQPNTPRSRSRMRSAPRSDQGAQYIP